MPSMNVYGKLGKILLGNRRGRLEMAIDLLMAMDSGYSSFVQLMGVANLTSKRFIEIMNQLIAYGLVIDDRKKTRRHHYRLTNKGKTVLRKIREIISIINMESDDV